MNQFSSFYNKGKKTVCVVPVSKSLILSCHTDDSLDLFGFRLRISNHNNQISCTAKYPLVEHKSNLWLTDKDREENQQDGEQQRN